MPTNRLFYALPFLTGSCLCALGQTSVPADSPQKSTYTLDVGTRLVIEDVSVTDKQGNPISGLPASAFHIFDNGAAQGIHDGRTLRR